MQSSGINYSIGICGLRDADSTTDDVPIGMRLYTSRPRSLCQNGFWTEAEHVSYNESRDPLIKDVMS